MDAKWRLKNHRFATGRHEGRWHVELAIPFAEIGATEADLSHPWGLRVGRNYHRPGDQQCWEHMGVAYTDVPTMPRISFRQDAPVVRVMSLRGEGAPRIELAVANPGARPLPVAAFISDTWHSNPPDEFEQTVTVAPGAYRAAIGSGTRTRPISADSTSRAGSRSPRGTVIETACRASKVTGRS